jgi:pimeloyl-ACP methyl ester carboxylesterase
MAATSPAWAGSPAAHVDQLVALGKHFRVIAPDTRGSGATAHRGGSIGFDTLTTDVVSLIAALGVDRPAIAGFSEGGATATLIAIPNPDLVGALVNPSGFDYFDPTAMAKPPLRPILGGRPDATEADPDAAERNFEQMGPGAAATFATMKADHDSAQGEGYWRTYLQQFFNRHTESFGHTLEDFAKVAAPTLLLTGDRDPFGSVELACTAYRTLDTGQLGIIPGAGPEISAASTTTMIDFLRTHATAA